VDPDAPLTLGALTRKLLVAPDTVARALAAHEPDPLRAWLLRRSRDVRRSFARDVIDAGGTRMLQERWLLLQDHHVRRSYVAEVIDATSSRDDD
jgi:hypothetical protein